MSRSEVLAQLQAQFGAKDGTEIWNDLRNAHDPEAPTTIEKRFPYLDVPRQPGAGAAIVDAGSIQAVTALTPLRTMSNALIVDESRSATGDALGVMGPQVGYYYPEILMEQDLHGGGVDARGVVFPGISLYVLLGRGKDFAWSATSSGSDNIDQFLEELCNPDGTPPTRALTHYRYNGACVAMTTFDAGVLRAGDGDPDQQVSFSETVHGPVSGTATVGGKPYAITTKRSTRGRETASVLAFYDLNSNNVDGARDWAKVMNQVEFTFNWFYVSEDHVAYFSSGRLPKRARGTYPGLPTLGTGEYEWRGFLARNDHPHAVDPDNGLLLNWNNSPAPGFGAADDNWGYGSIDHVELFTPFARRDNRIENVVAVMNKAATQDDRSVLVWPVISRVARRTRARPVDRGRRCSCSTTGSCRVPAVSTSRSMAGSIIPARPSSTGRSGRFSIPRWSRCSARSSRPFPVRVSVTMSTKTCAHCSVSGSRAATAVLIAATATSPPAGRHSGRRWPRPWPVSPVSSARIRRRGRPTPTTSAFASHPVSSGRRCATATVRPSSR